MDIPRRPGTPSSPEAAVRQTWSNQKGVITSPDPLHTGPHFDLNSVSANSLPNIQITRGNGSIGLSTCPCAVNCNKNCCKSSRAMIGTKPDPYGDETPLLSPVKNSIQRSESPAGSYGSTDSSDQLLSDEEAKVRTSGHSVDIGYDSDSKLEASVKCGCHVIVKDKTSRSANIKLVIASFIALFFMIGEVLGGYFAGSLAIMTDAAHMLSDLAGFLISLFAIWVGSRPPSKRMSFGWHRAEVIGAIISVLIVWVLTGVLFYEAIQRVINPDLINVKADIMLITACVGVFVNVFMCAVLGHGHGHSHGGGGHGHSHGGHGSKRGGHSHSHDDVEEGNSRLSRFKRRLRRNKKQENAENINVRAAFVHVIGDLIQSIGVVIAGYIIWFRPDWKIADPICTFLFCVLVLFSTINVLKDALRVLMEGTPSHIDYEDVKADLQEIAGVKQAHSLHIWSLTTTRTALAAHLAMETGVNAQEVLDKASKMLKDKHNIVHTTLQVEDHHNLMDDCGTCQQQTKPKSKLCWIC
ncbi:probable proton-coupled zinc antiporter SLC30A4 [Halichondria panicea]|uniref:probable proton-coupled zinc antiporter SLC30A4 n=1 Tax=Halichondria panicea TaxID=6063 RepID=UPI00312B5705